MMGKKNGGIRLKIWAAIMSTAVLVIGALWILQVVLMEDYYLKQKSNDILADTKTIVNELNQESISIAINEISKIVSEKTLCVDISDEQGNGIVECEGLGDNCFLHMNYDNKQAVVAETIKNDGGFVQIDIKHPEFNTRYNTCSVLTDTKDGKRIVTVTATLAPVVEATTIIKNQLIYVSIVLVLVSTIIAFLLSRSLTKPIRKITNAAREIAQGNLNADAYVKSNDEIGELSQSFLYMTKELAKVNILQKELVANISHDIRTPLTVIKGYAETIKDITGDNKQLREHQLDIIVEETNRLNTLVSDALDLSLLQAGRIPLNLKSFDIATKVEDILSRFELYEHAQGFTFSMVNKSEHSTVVLADEMRIEQVLYNLIYNAINHIGETKNIVVTISYIEGSVRVEVSDTGKGISQEDLPLIWDRYYKPYKKGDQKGAGTGLGLSIVKAILINHGSRFGVYSTLGVGSTFWFTLANMPNE